MKELAEEKQKQEAEEIEMRNRGIRVHVSPFKDEMPTREYDDGDSMMGGSNRPMSSP